MMSKVIHKNFKISRISTRVKWGLHAFDENFEASFLFLRWISTYLVRGFWIILSPVMKVLYDKNHGLVATPDCTPFDLSCFERLLKSTLSSWYPYRCTPESSRLPWTMLIRGPKIMVAGGFAYFVRDKSLRICIYTILCLHRYVNPIVLDRYV